MTEAPEKKVEAEKTAEKSSVVSKAEPKSEGDLQTQISQLKAQLGKQRKVITDTAQQLMELQLKLSKEKFQNIPNPADIIGSKATGAAPAGFDPDNYATNEDIVQLVGELQGQLNILDQKSLLRSWNSGARDPEDEIKALPNIDGELPVVFPETLAKLATLPKDTLLYLLNFYDLLPAKAAKSAADALKAAEANVPTIPKASDYTDAELEDLYQDLRLHIGAARPKSTYKPVDPAKK